MKSRRAGHGALGLLAWSALLGAAALSCQREPVPEASAHAPGPEAPGPDPGARAAFDEEAFTLRLEPRGEYAAGQVAEVDVHLTAKTGFKCNDKYPFKFKAQPSAGVAYATDLVRQDAMRFEGKSDAIMPVRFTPAAAGAQTVGGTFSFSLCTEDQCLVERRELSLAVDVR